MIFTVNDLTDLWHEPMLPGMYRMNPAVVCMEEGQTAKLEQLYIDTEQPLLAEHIINKCPVIHSAK